MTQLPAEITQEEADVSEGSADPTAARIMGHRILVGMGVLALLVWVLSGIYRVEVGEVAIVERFGQYQQDAIGRALQVDKGLHYAWPWPIERVYRIPTQVTSTLDVATFLTAEKDLEELKKELLRRGIAPNLVDAALDPYVITADRNALHLRATVTYKISDPEAYLQATARVEQDKTKRDQMFRKVFEQVLVRHMAQRHVSRLLGLDITTQPMTPLADELLAAARTELAGMDAQSGTSLGLAVERVDVGDLKPPQLVQAAFDAVLVARNQQQILSSQAETYRKQRLSSATAEAAAQVTQAQAYADEVLRAAEGEKARFLSLWTEYQRDPVLTRLNLSTEASRMMFDSLTRVYYVRQGQKLTLFLPPPPPKSLAQPGNLPSDTPAGTTP